MTNPPTIEDLLEAARRRIEVEPEEIDEARTRRNAIGAALRDEFPGSRVYVNGSLAHGDALTPLSDVDLGVVVPDPDHEYGPGKRGPRALQDRAADAIRSELKDTYGDLRVQVEGNKRSVKIWFRDPVHPGGPDFTADVIVAIDDPAAPGLYIPRYATWDKSHPERHTQLVLAAIKDSEVRFARVVRLLKHWDRHRSTPPLCSWHIKVLGLDCLDTPGSLRDGLVDWFEHTERAIQDGPTPDPAHVGPDIETVVPKTEALRHVRNAIDGLREAIELEDAGWHTLAHDKLAKLFNDAEMLPAPPRHEVEEQEAERLRHRRDADRHAHTRPRPALAPPPVRSWSW